MIGFKASNKAKSRLYAGMNSIQTYMDIKPGTRDIFPDEFPFSLIIEKKSGSVTTRAEIVKVTGNPSTDRFTIVRASEKCPISDTSMDQVQTPQEFDAGDYITLIMTAGMYDDLRDAIDGKLNKSGFNPNKILTTNSNGDVVETNISEVIPDSSTIKTEIFHAGEQINTGDAVCLENMELDDPPIFGYSLSNPATGTISIPITEYIGANYWVGYKFTFIGGGYISGIIIPTPSSQPGPTHWRLTSDGGSIILNGTISGENISITPTYLTGGTSYRIECTNTSSPFYAKYDSTGGGYPVSSNGVTFISGSAQGADSNMKRAISGIVIQTIVQNLSAISISNIAGTKKKSIAIVGTGVQSNSLELQLGRIGSPQNIGIRIETDNAGNPSGTLADTNSSATVASASIPTTPVTQSIPGTVIKTTVTFPGNFILASGTLYHIVFFQGSVGSEIVDASNYYMTSKTDLKTCQLNKLWNGTSWSQDVDKRVCLKSNLFQKYLLAKTNASYAYKSNFDGIAESSFSRGQIAVISRFGMTKTLSGLTPRTKYYLANSDGAISATAGTNTRAVGTALTENILDIGMYPST